MTNAHTMIKNQAKTFVKFAACFVVSRIFWLLVFTDRVRLLVSAGSNLSRRYGFSLEFVHPARLRAARPSQSCPDPFLLHRRCHRLPVAARLKGFMWKPSVKWDCHREPFYKRVPFFQINDNKLFWLVQLSSWVSSRPDAFTSTVYPRHVASK